MNMSPALPYAPASSERSFSQETNKKEIDCVSQLGKKALLNFWSSSQMIHSYIRVELRKKKKILPKGG